MKSRIIAENENWRIRQASGDNFAITCGKVHFTFYIQGRDEKLAFYNILKILQERVEDVAFVTFGGWFGLYLTPEDITFFLENLPVSDAEKEVSVNLDEKITIQ